MNHKTLINLHKAIDSLNNDSLSAHDRLMAERGVNDEFFQSLFDDGLVTEEDILQSILKQKGGSN